MLHPARMLINNPPTAQMMNVEWQQRGVSTSLSSYLLVVYSFCVCVGKAQLLIKLLSANRLRTTKCAAVLIFVFHAQKCKTMNELFF
jgi:hypothetical protein